MGTGLHGENGLDPETSISLLKTYFSLIFCIFSIILESAGVTVIPL
jgi:hypothetical protein